MATSTQTADALTAKRKHWEQVIGSRMGMRITDYDGQVWVLDGVNDTGVLYWVKPGQKTQYTVEGYRVKDLDDLKRRNPAKLERCVADVERRGQKGNAYAICNAAINPWPGALGHGVKTAGSDTLHKVGEHIESPVYGYVVVTGVYTTDFADGSRDKSMASRYIYTVEKVTRTGKATGRQGAGFSKPRRRNPEDESEAMYASFHGRPSEEMVEFEEQEHFHENLAGLGVLVELRVRTVTGLERSLGFETGEGETAENPRFADHYAKGKVAVSKLPKRVKEYPTSYDNEVRDFARKYANKYTDSHPEESNTDAYLEFYNGLIDQLYTSSQAAPFAVFEHRGDGEYQRATPTSPKFESESQARKWLKENLSEDEHFRGGKEGRGFVVRRALNPVWPFGPGQPLGSRTTVTHIDKRSKARTTTTGAGTYKGYAIFKQGDGTFEVPQIDRESRFDTKRDAQRFIDEEVRYARNPEPAMDAPAERTLQLAVSRLGHRQEILDIAIAIAKEDGRETLKGKDVAEAAQYQSGGGWSYLQHLASLPPTKDAHGRPDGDTWLTPRAKTILKKRNPGPVSSTIGFGGKILGDLDRRVGKAIGYKGNPLKQLHYSPLVTNASLNRNQASRMLQAGMSPREIADAFSKVFKVSVEDGREKLGMKYDSEIADGSGRLETKYTISSSAVTKEIAAFKARRKSKPNPEPISTSTTLLTSNEAGTQLFFTGGDQSLDLDALKFSEAEQEKELITIGDCFFVSYLTQKDFDDFETIVYEHELGEESGVCPQLIYDRLNKRLMLSGGEYHIPRPMLETSPGITN